MEKNLNVTTNNNEVVTAGADTKITVVDLGNLNIKYYTEGVNGNFSSRISTDYHAYQEGLNRIEMDGKITYIGIGELNREFNKCERDYMAQLLYAICKCHEDSDVIETNLTLLLPSLQMDNKSKLIENLKGKDFSFKYNGKDRMITIKDMMVMPEGFSSYFSLSEEDQLLDVLILDLGSRTVNICGMVNQEIEILQTIKLGSFDFYNKIRSEENAKGNDYNEETVVRCINNGIIKVTDLQHADFLKDILNSIKGYVSLKTYNKVVFTGGTSLMLEKVINKLTKLEYEIHKDALNSNVLGAYEVSKMEWSA